MSELLHTHVDLEASKEALYDYVMRMTGQINRSHETIDEVFYSVQAVSSLDAGRHLQKLLYKTARKFAFDIWNADTSRLVNPAYEGDHYPKDEELHRVELAFRMLPPLQREVLILHVRAGFSWEETAEITRIQKNAAEELAAVGLHTLNELLGSPKHLVEEKSILRLRPFVTQETNSVISQNLSSIVKAFRNVNRDGKGFKMRSMFHGLVLLGAFALGFYLLRYFWR